MNVYTQHCVCSTCKHLDKYLFEEANEWVRNEWMNECIMGHGTLCMEDMVGRELGRESSLRRIWNTLGRFCRWPWEHFHRNGTQRYWWYNRPPRRLFGRRIERTMAAGSILNSVPAVMTVITVLFFLSTDCFLVFAYLHIDESTHPYLS